MSDHPTTPLKIEGPLTLYTVETLRAQWSERLTVDGGLHLDLGAVDACDCAGLQLLCSARKSATVAPSGWNVTALSPSIIQAAEGIGLSLTEITPTPTPV